MRSKSPETMREVYEFIETYYAEHGCPPPVQVIADEVGLAKSTTHKYIKALEDEGKLEQADGNRGYRPLTNRLTMAVEVPRVGYISCGLPITAEQNIEEYVSLPRWLLRSDGKYFCLQASGDSMIGAGIDDGDMVVVRQQETADIGNIVVALTPDGESTLKRLFYDTTSGQIILHPENVKYQDMFFDEVYVQGVVEKVIKDFN